MSEQYSPTYAQYVRALDIVERAEEFRARHHIPPNVKNKTEYLGLLYRDNSRFGEGSLFEQETGIKPGEVLSAMDVVKNYHGKPVVGRSKIPRWARDEMKTQKE